MYRAGLFCEFEFGDGTWTPLVIFLSTALNSTTNDDPRARRQRSSFSHVSRAGIHRRHLRLWRRWKYVSD